MKSLPTLSLYEPADNKNEFVIFRHSTTKKVNKKREKIIKRKTIKKRKSEKTNKKIKRASSFFNIL
jgi:hypothetical protein